MTVPAVHLVGAGVVGRAIIRAHTTAGISVTVCDEDPGALSGVIDALALPTDRWRNSELFRPDDWLPSIALWNVKDTANASPPILIESISEQLEIKRSFFDRAAQYLGDSAILCSNTSTLRIRSIFESTVNPLRCCGMHFFMPVDRRKSVEVVRAGSTSGETIDLAKAHAQRLGKEPLAVTDGPGFVVNRLLSPYLNEAMLLLQRGVTAERIEQAALRFGMPLSPLELIDWIGAKTMFQAGRVFWQSFPGRMNPSPILPGLIKANRFGRDFGGGFYDYHHEQRSDSLSPQAMQLTSKYQRASVPWSDEEIMHGLSIPMWIEAALAWRDGVVDSIEVFDHAMEGGLGFRTGRSWLGFFDALGSRTITRAIKRFREEVVSMRAPVELIRALEDHSPSAAITAWCDESTSVTNRPV